jgi:hypothetical protein
VVQGGSSPDGSAFPRTDRSTGAPGATGARRHRVHRVHRRIHRFPEGELLRLGLLQMVLAARHCVVRYLRSVSLWRLGWLPSEVRQVLGCPSALREPMSLGT